MANRTSTIGWHCLLDALAGTLTRVYFLMGLVVMLVAWFTAELAVIEQNAFRLAVTAALIRPLAVMVVILQICNGFNESVRAGQLQLLLSMDLSRSQYLVGRMIGGIGFASCIAVATIIAVVPWCTWDAAFLWIAALFFELAVMSLFALFVAVTFSSLGAAVLLSLSFYLLCRFIESFVLIASSTNSGMALEWLFGLSWLLPNFGRYSQSSWLIYGDGSWAVLQPLFFETLMVGAILFVAAMIDFSRREI